MCRKAFCVFSISVQLYHDETNISKVRRRFSTGRAVNNNVMKAGLEHIEASVTQRNIRSFEEYYCFLKLNSCCSTRVTIRIICACTVQVKIT